MSKKLIPMNVWKKIYFLGDRIPGLFGKSIFEFEKFKVKRNLGERVSDYKFTLIAGCPRSGTTLLKSVLSVHPNVSSMKGEIDFSGKKMFGKWKKYLDLEEMPSSKDAKSMGEMFEKYSKGKHFLVKRPTSIFYLDLLWGFFPKMKVIHIIRDGRAVVSSLKKSRHFHWDVSFSSRQWKKIMGIGRNYKNNKNYYEVRYEDLLRDPYKTINSILEFMGEKPMKKEEILNFHKRTDKSKLSVKNASKPFKKSTMFKWKKELSKKDLKTFNNIAENVLEGEKYV